jgi:hypothetical protein
MVCWLCNSGFVSAINKYYSQWGMQINHKGHVWKILEYTLHSCFNCWKLWRFYGIWMTSVGERKNISAVIGSISMFPPVLAIFLHFFSVFPTMCQYNINFIILVIVNVIQCVPYQQPSSMWPGAWGTHQLCTQLLHHCLEQMLCQLVPESTLVALQAEYSSHQSYN